MGKKKRAATKEELWGAGTPPELPAGVKLVRTLREHTGWIGRIAWSPDGRILASPSLDRTVRLWDAETGQCLRTLKKHDSGVYCVAFDPQGPTLASGGADKSVKLWNLVSGKLLNLLRGHSSTINSIAFDPQGHTLAGASDDSTVRLWDVASGKLIRSLGGHSNVVLDVAFDPVGHTLASASYDKTVRLWDPSSGKLLRSLEGHSEYVFSVVFNPQGRTLASASSDSTVKLWDAASGRLLRSLEGHTGGVTWVTFSHDGRLLASRGLGEETVRVWRSDTGACVATILEPGGLNWGHGLAVHPHRSQVATVGSDSRTPMYQRGRVIHIWELDVELLLGEGARVPGVHHTTGKIVLVGDHSVGKSALGHRMIHGEYKEQASTHGQQFWVFPELGKRREDGTECEAILWDLAGQPDYRLVHALFVDDADLGLVLFDAADIRDPLHGVEFWLKQLRRKVHTVQEPGDEMVGGAHATRCPVILVAAQTDRGSCSLTDEELKAFCEKHGVIGPIQTSALSGDGVKELIEKMKGEIAWEEKPATVTTTTFKRIKDFVLGLKEAETDGQRIVTPEELRRRLEATDTEWEFTDGEMLTAVGHLGNYGYVKKLRTSKGEARVLLRPELLNNLASSFVLEARRNPKGLGALEERRLLSGGYAFGELAELSDEERDVLLDAAALLFLEHNVCFRETDPLRVEPYLVFPELINLKKPVEEDRASDKGAAYTVSGPTENVFASLVVLLGYTQTFTRTTQWQNNARYEVGEGLVCGFRQEGERDGELDFVLCFCPDVPARVRTLFQSLFENFLARRNLTVMRYEPVVCSKGHALNRNVVRESLQQGDKSAFCSKCGEKLTLPTMAEPIQLTREEQAEVDVQRRTAEQRTRFEQAAFRVQAYAEQEGIKVPECFISYAWGEAEHERWVEKSLATDLQKAGIDVVLDRWDNQRIGASVPRFVERIATCDRVVVVGTPLYREKYDNNKPMGGYVVAAEGDLIGTRMIDAEAEKASVLPILLAGEKKESFPPLLHGRVYADFRDEEAYFATAFDLILSLYAIKPRNPAVADLRESLGGGGVR